MGRNERGIVDKVEKLVDVPREYGLPKGNEPGGPAIDEAGNVLGLSINRENDPYFPSQSFTNFIRIEQAIDLLPGGNALPGCRRESSAATDVTPPIDTTDQIKSIENGSVFNLQYDGQAVLIRPGSYALDSRDLRLHAKRLVLSGPVIIRSSDERTVPPPAQAAQPGGPGGQAGGDGQNGARGTQGGTGQPGADGKQGRPGGAFLIDVQDMVIPDVLL
jgi:hypothetical protein